MFVLKIHSSALKYDNTDFSVVSAILRLAAKYQVKHIRTDLIRGLSALYPKTLAQWEIREARVTSPSGAYDPRKTIPHPMFVISQFCSSFVYRLRSFSLVINLARTANALELLPSAYYDLSRSSPSDCAAGYVCATTSEMHYLSDNDLLVVLRGKEHASRFLSTFIVKELEGRDASPFCELQSDLDASRKRICQAAFEAVTFEILRDVNGVVCHRSSDPLFAIMDAEMMQTREDTMGRPYLVLRACEACRAEFAVAVDVSREEFWQRLPQWFGIDPQVWA